MVTRYVSLSRLGTETELLSQTNKENIPPPPVPAAIKNQAEAAVPTKAKKSKVSNNNVDNTISLLIQIFRCLL